MSAITDWNDEYNNIDHTPGASAYFDEWPKMANKFRETKFAQGHKMIFGDRYGSKERNKVDMFVPTCDPKGLFIFVHGGYWYKFGREYFHQVAQGPLKNDYAVAIPSYTLCPNATISEISREISTAINHLAKSNHVPQEVPIVVCGHSAGGHLVTRQVCGPPANKHLSNLDQTVLDRLKCIISISGVHDLRPIVRTAHNEMIRLTEEEAWAESPAMLKPLEGIPVICLVGTKERPEFIRQTDLLGIIWRGMGVETTTIHMEDRHHFDIIEDLMNPDGMICQYLK
jgi:hypothetical protein